MRKLVFIVVILFITGCSQIYVDGALLLHSEKRDAPEVTLQNPLAELEVGMEVDRTSIFLRHTSGIFDREVGYGMNSIGVKHRIW